MSNAPFKMKGWSPFTAVDRNRSRSKYRVPGFFASSRKKRSCVMGHELKSQPEATRKDIVKSVKDMSKKEIRQYISNVKKQDSYRR